jgi:hypothetical protein
MKGEIFVLKKKRLISRAVLKTELHMIMLCIESMNYGYAKETAAQILNRVNEYDLIPPKKEEACPTNTDCKTRVEQ